SLSLSFFFQAEDGIRDRNVTGVQTCALPILLLLFSGTFDTLTDTLVFVSWIFYAASAWSVFELRRTQPDSPRPYRVPGYPVVPALFIMFAALYLAFTIYNDVAGYRAAVAAGKPAII